MKLYLKVMENGDSKIAFDNIKVLGSEIKTIKEKNGKLLQKIN